MGKRRGAERGEVYKGVAKEEVALNCYLSWSTWGHWRAHAVKGHQDDLFHCPLVQNSQPVSLTLHLLANHLHLPLEPGSLPSHSLLHLFQFSTQASLTWMVHLTHIAA